MGLGNFTERRDEYQFNYFVEFLLELQHICLSKIKLAMVIILSPDKSMTLLVNKNGATMLVESHLHLNTGAIIATAAENEISAMVHYIEYMAVRDWGSNVTPFDVTFLRLK